MMMTTTEMSKTMQEFFEDYNGKDEEINRLKAELDDVKAKLAERNIEFERISIELQNATKPKERQDYGIRTFECFGKRWYVATDLLASCGYKIGANGPSSRNVMANKVKVGMVRKFTYAEMCDKIENASHVGVYCVDERGAREICEKVGRDYV